LNRLADAIARVSLGIACVLAAAIFVLVNVEVICRYVFGISTLVADEYGAYAFAGMVYLGMVHALHQDALIRIDIPGRWQHFVTRPALKLFAAVAALALNLILLYAGYLTFAASLRFQSRSIQASKTLLAWPQGLMLAGLALLVVVSIAVVVRTTRHGRAR
jgi:TRAP-type C4-dicarboxylate transport system permease small subunit